MRRPLWALSGLLAAPALLAAPDPKPGPSARPAASASGSARPAPPASAIASAMASGALPSGHPPVDPGDLPPGHPPSGHGHGGGDRVKSPQVSKAAEDPTLPAGVIEVVMVDGEGKPLGGREVTLGIVKNSVAEGESRDRRTARTDDEGKARFAGLSTASVFAYRVSTVRDGASYAAPPFNLPQNAGMKATLFAYPVSTNVDQLAVAAQGMAYVEIRDETLQIEVAYRIYNLSSTTWLATDTVTPLPEGFKAFNAQRAMSDLGWEGAPAGARFRGTVSPGIHDTAFRFQVPLPPGDEATLDLGLLPHVQAFRVISDAPKGLELEVDGFPQATPSTNNNGQKILVVEKELPRPDSSFRRVRVHLNGMPTKPRGRWYALGVALAMLGLGGAAAFQMKSGQAHDENDLREARKRLLDELEQLEKDHASGEVGPRTYEAARRSLLDALARVVQSSPG